MRNLYSEEIYFLIQNQTIMQSGMFRRILKYFHKKKYYSKNIVTTSGVYADSSATCSFKHLPES